MRVNVLSDGRFLNSGRFRPITNVRAAFTHRGKYQTLTSSPRDDFLTAFMDANDLDLGEDDLGEDNENTVSTQFGKPGYAAIMNAGCGSNDNFAIAASPAKLRLRYKRQALKRAADITPHRLP
jgi:hypothetical protein